MPKQCHTITAVVVFSAIVPFAKVQAKYICGSVKWNIYFVPLNVKLSNDVIMFVNLMCQNNLSARTIGCRLCDLLI